MKPSLLSLGALAALVPVARSVQETAPAPQDARTGLQRVAPAESGDPPAPAEDLPGLLGGELDRERWRARLSDADLARRERAFDQLVARARLDPVARAWIEELARAPEAAELAWTARLALREIGRARFPLRYMPGGSDPLDLFGQMERRMQELLARADPNFLGPQLPARTGQVDARRSARSVHVEQTPEGARVRVTQTVDGAEAVREYAGADLAEILRTNPDLASELGGLELDVAPGAPLDLRFDLGGASAPGDTERRERAPPARGPLPLEPEAFSRPIVTDRLGVNVEALGAARARDLGLAGGLLVLRAVPQTYAHLLGVAAGDVLVELDGRALTTADDIEAAMRARGADDPLTLVWIDRLGQRRAKTWRPAQR